VYLAGPQLIEADTCRGLAAERERHLVGRSQEPSAEACRTTGRMTTGTSRPLSSWSRGVDVRVVQGNLGHSSPDFTRKRYQHVTPRLQRDAAEKIGGALWDDSRK
jgi:integrase